MGMRRWWVLATSPVVLAVGAPWLLVWLYADRLPERAYVYGWSRVGSDFAHLAPSWPGWAADYLFLVLYGGLMVAGLVRLRRWPSLQRLVIVVTWAVAGQVISQAVLGVVLLLDHPGQPTAWWASPASVGVGLVAGAVAWLLVGPLPSASDAVGPVPEGVPVRQLRPAERVMFSQSMWSVRALVVGGVLVLGVPIAVVLNGFTTVPTMLLVLGAALVPQSRARVQVDGKGVLLELPLLGARRRIPYREVRYAEAVGHGPTRGWWPLLENTRRSGYVVDSGPAMVLRLSDDRTFVVSARDTAAALVNGELARQRVGAEPC